MEQVDPGDRHQDDACAVPRLRAGDDRVAAQRCRLARLRHSGRAGARPRRQAARARRHRQCPHAAAAGRADGRRGGRARLRRGWLPRHHGALPARRPRRSRCSIARSTARSRRRRSASTSPATGWSAAAARRPISRRSSGATRRSGQGHRHRRDQGGVIAPVVAASHEMSAAGLPAEAAKQRRLEARPGIEPGWRTLHGLCVATPPPGRPSE